jgi:hypothetical protein
VSGNIFDAKQNPPPIGEWVESRGLAHGGKWVKSFYAVSPAGFEFWFQEERTKSNPAGAIYNVREWRTLDNVVDEMENVQ